jgi:hypothetical protein
MGITYLPRPQLNFSKMLRYDRNYDILQALLILFLHQMLQI